MLLDGPSWYYASYKFCYWLLDMAACCLSGIDLRNQLDHNFPFQLNEQESSLLG